MDIYEYFLKREYENIVGRKIKEPTTFLKVVNRDKKNFITLFKPEKRRSFYVETAPGAEIVISSEEFPQFILNSDLFEIIHSFYYDPEVDHE